MIRVAKSYRDTCGQFCPGYGVIFSSVALSPALVEYWPSEFSEAHMTVYRTSHWSC